MPAKTGMSQASAFNVKMGMSSSQKMEVASLYRKFHPNKQFTQVFRAHHMGTVDKTQMLKHMAIMTARANTGTLILGTAMVEAMGEMGELATLPLDVFNKIHKVTVLPAKQDTICKVVSVAL